MQKRVLAILEYDKVLLMLKEHAVSGPGAEAALFLRPATGREEAARMLAETAEAASMLSTLAAFPMAAFCGICLLYTSPSPRDS